MATTAEYTNIYLNLDNVSSVFNSFQMNLQDILSTHQLQNQTLLEYIERIISVLGSILIHLFDGEINHSCCRICVNKPTPQLELS